MSKLVTALGVLTAVAFAVAPEMVEISHTFARYVMLVGLAAAAAGRELRPADVRQVRSLLGTFPKRGMFAPRKTLKLLLAVGLAGALLSSSACKSETVRGVSAGIAAGATVMRGEVEAGVSAGDITQDEADFINPVIDEIERASADIAVRAEGWDSMTKPERRALALEAVEKIGNSVQRLSDRGVGVKSERGRARLDKYLRQARRAVGLLRVVEAAIPRKG
ncbi:MAG: hypothetical protein LC795_15565 [Acidobacteria bacterium]|nr:hypothetical protein [Acidobacteriota bacterium]MCA1620693.1 hypothetical protein [Acidobacteriota bacterium]